MSGSNAEVKLRLRKNDELLQQFAIEIKRLIYSRIALCSTGINDVDAFTNRKKACQRALLAAPFY